MQTVFNYNGHEIVVDGSKHIITIDGVTADGANRPTGAVVSKLNSADDNICMVKTELAAIEQEKNIAYGSPLKVGDPVIIIGSMVIPANLLVRNDLEDDYGVWQQKLIESAESNIASANEIGEYWKGILGEYAHELTANLAGTAEELRVMLEELINGVNNDKPSLDLSSFVRRAEFTMITEPLRNGIKVITEELVGNLHEQLDILRSELNKNYPENEVENEE